MAGEILVAKETFTTSLPDGTPVTVIEGQTRIRKGQSLLKDFEHLFKPLTTQYDVEQATKKPGEKRQK